MPVRVIWLKLRLMAIKANNSENDDITPKENYLGCSFSIASDRDPSQSWIELASDYELARAREDSLDRLVEWPTQRDLLGDVTGRSVLDVGCGNGGKVVEADSMPSRLDGYPADTATGTWVSASRGQSFGVPVPEPRRG